MRNAAHTAFVIMAILLSFACAAAAAEGALEPDGAGVRFYAQAGESCLTREKMPEEALARLGVDGQTTLAAMERDGSVLMVLDESGRQVSLCVSEAPEGVTARDVSRLDAVGREALLLALARSHAAQSAAWLPGMEDYALCESVAGETALPMHTLTLDTLYLSRVYTFRMEVIGREAGDADREYLRSVASRTLRLGAVASESGASPLEIPKMPALTDENAAVTMEDGGVSLTLNPVPSVIGSNSLALGGNTDPKAKVRYQVNGEASSAFSPEADGSFSALARNLRTGADNKISVTVRLGDKATTHSFVVNVQWQDTPLALSVTRATTYADALAVEGVTLPGATVEVKKGRSTVTAAVDENGRFSFELATKKQGNYSFSVRAVYSGYRRSELKGQIRRESQATAQKTADRLDYQALLAKPASYADTPVFYEATVSALAYENGQAKCLLDAGNGTVFVLLCENLLDLRTGQELRALGTLTGAVESFGGNAYPAMALDAIIP